MSGLIRSRSRASQRDARTGRGTTDRGVASIVVAAMLIPLVLVVAVVVDGARVLVQRQQAQDAAEAAATLAGSSWRPGSDPSACYTADMSLLVTDNAGDRAAGTCTWNGGASVGRFDVTVERQVDTLFGALLGRPAPTVTATASAEVGQAGAAGGLRPLGLCLNHPAVPGAEVPASGGKGGGGGGGGGKKPPAEVDPNAPVKIMIDSDDGGCGSASGNWGVLDLNGGSQSNSETQEWIQFGYQGLVSGNVNGNTGVPSGSFRLDTIVDPSNSDPSRIITVPLYRTIGGSGANATFEVVSFISLTVTDFKLTGSGRYIEVAFKTVDRPIYGAAGIDASLYRGVNSWRICALDDTGVCT
jgi:Flp pilus assembly protein TadG